MIQQYTITLKSYPKGIHLITNELFSNIKKLPKEGIINIFIQHTSAGICINENADPSVRTDMDMFFNKLVPENAPYYKHIYEGSDDMPSHIKTTIFGNSISIPIVDYRIGLGMWQGIYLGEFRNQGGMRKLVISIYS